MDDENQSLADNIRRFREAAGLSQAELAEALTREGVAGMYPQTIAKLEGGSRALKFSEGIHMAQVVGVRPEQLANLDQSAFGSALLSRALRDVRQAYTAAVEALMEYGRRRMDVVSAAKLPHPREMDAEVVPWLSRSVMQLVEAVERDQPQIFEVEADPYVAGIARELSKMARPTDQAPSAVEALRGPVQPRDRPSRPAEVDPDI